MSLIRLIKFRSLAGGTFKKEFGERGSGDGQFNGTFDLAFDVADNIYVPIVKMREIDGPSALTVHVDVICGDQPQQ